MSVEIEDVSANPSEIHVGESARIEWRIESSAHQQIWRWVTLFPGIVDGRTTEGPAGVASLVPESDHGAFSCGYKRDEKLVCVTKSEEANGTLVVDVADVEVQDLTVRACILGLDSGGESAAVCDYRPITLTLK